MFISSCVVTHGLIDVNPKTKWLISPFSGILSYFKVFYSPAFMPEVDKMMNMRVYYVLEQNWKLYSGWTSRLMLYAESEFPPRIFPYWNPRNVVKSVGLRCILVNRKKADWNGPYLRGGGTWYGKSIPLALLRPVFSLLDTSQTSLRQAWTNPCFGVVSELPIANWRNATNPVSTGMDRLAKSYHTLITHTTDDLLMWDVFMCPRDTNPLGRIRVLIFYVYACAAMLYGPLTKL